MAARYVNVDRETPLLLPMDLRDWVKGNDLVQVIVEAVEACDLGGLEGSGRGTGDAQYPPRMMLALLIYAYATGLYSSRRIEQATYDSVSLRYLCANWHPDHTTIAEFRRRHDPLLRRCFGEVLYMAKRSGLLRLGAVSLDGTRVPGAGSAKAVRTLAEIDAELAALEQQGAEWLAQAEAADRAPLELDLQLPPELAHRHLRQEKLKAARAEILRRREQAQSEGRRRTHESAHRTARASVSEPQSRGLRKGASGGAVQGYNAQVVVDAGPSGLIVGQLVSDEAADNYLLGAGVAAIAPEAGRPGVVLVDKGYESAERIAAVEAAHGVTILCPVKAAPFAVARTRHTTRRDRRISQLRREMHARFQHPESRALYERRRSTVEPAIARLKQNLGFRRFRCWGLGGASAEWSLLCLAHNVRLVAAARRRPAK
jgi:transposase